MRKQKEVLKTHIPGNDDGWYHVGETRKTKKKKNERNAVEIEER